MDAARAEALANANVRRQPSARALTAKVYFEAERVELGEMTLDSIRHKVGVLLAKISTIEILDPDDQVIATIAADSLPTNDLRTSATPPPAPPPTTRQPTGAEQKAEDERRRQAEQARQSEELSKALQKRAEETIEKGMRAIREPQCRNQAAQASPDPKSKAYQAAYEKCMAAK